MMTNSIQTGHVRHWGFVVALLLGCVAPGRIWAQAGDERAALDKVFEDWKARRTLLKSARYVLTGTTEYKDKSLPPGNPLRPRRIVLLFDFDREYYRRESSTDVIANDGKGPSKYQTWFSSVANNGELAQMARHKKASGIEDDEADLFLEKYKSGGGVQCDYEERPIFFAHGLVATVHTVEPKGWQQLSYDPDDFFLGGRQLLRGQNCLIVRTEPAPGMSPTWDEFWINPAQKSAIPRYIYFNGDNNPWARLDITWKSTEYGWLPDNWSYTFSMNKQVMRVVRLRVESFEANPEVSKEDFTLPVEPGMKVTIGERPPYGKGLDPNKAATKTYVISPSGSWDEVAAKGFTTLEGKELPPERPWKRVAWISLAVVAVLAAFLYALRRRRRKAVV